MTAPNILTAAEQIRQRKLSRAGLKLNALVLGENGVGKRSFLNTLCGQQFFDLEESSEPEDETGCPLSVVESPMSIDCHTIDVVESSSVPIHLRVSVTQNLGFNIKNSENSRDVLLYIEHELQQTLDEEMKVRRNPKQQDHRIHVALYFISGSDKGLTALDIEIMKAIGPRVNLIPIIGKADGLTETELVARRHAIVEDIHQHLIEVFNFVCSAEEEGFIESRAPDQEDWAYLSSLLESVPFAIISSNDKDDPQVRHTPWGTLRITDPKVCDYVLLQNVLFGSHIQELKDTTVNVKYEKYRIDQLQQLNPPLRGNSL